MEYHKDNDDRFVTLNHTGFGKMTSFDVEGDELIIKIKITEYGHEMLGRINFENGDRIGDIDLSTYNQNPEPFTWEKFRNLMNFSPLVEWASGKQGYKMYCNGLDGRKLYVRDIASLPESQRKRAEEILNFALKESSLIFKKYYDLHHELFHMMNSQVKPEVEGQGPDDRANPS